MAINLIIGLLAVIVAGGFTIALKTILDLTVVYLGPHILSLCGEESPVRLIAGFFDVVTIFLIGSLIRHIKFGTVTNRIMKRLLPQKKHGAFVKVAPGVYYLALIVKKEIRWKRLNGDTTKFCLVFYPSPPMGWTSGLPISFVRHDKVFPLNSPLQEILTTVASLGLNSPEEFEEIKHNDVD